MSLAEVLERWDAMFDRLSQELAKNPTNRELIMALEKLRVDRESLHQLVGKSYS